MSPAKVPRHIHHAGHGPSKIKEHCREAAAVRLGLLVPMGPMGDGSLSLWVPKTMERWDDDAVSNHIYMGQRKPSQIGMKLWKETTNQLISVKHAKKRPAMQTCTGNTEQCVNMRIMVRLTSKYSFCLNTSPLGPCHWMLCSANKIAQWAATIKAIQSMEEFASAARPANPRNRKSTTLAQQNSLTMPYITTGLTTGKVWPSQSSHSSADHVVFFQWTHRRIGRGPPHSAEPPTMDERMSGRSQWITSRPALGPCLYVWTYIHVQYVCIYIYYILCHTIYL